MDPLHLGISMIPLAVYLLVLAAINLSRRPLVTTGVRDLSALAIAISGLLAAGPVELFLPSYTFSVYGIWVWPMLLFLYVLCVTMTVWTMRPRIVVYNITGRQLLEAMDEVVMQLDPEARRMGSVFLLPGRRLQWIVQDTPAMRCATLTIIGRNWNLSAWRELTSALAGCLRDRPVDRNPVGWSMIFFAVLMLIIVLVSLAYNPEQLLADWRAILRLG